MSEDLFAPVRRTSVGQVVLFKDNVTRAEGLVMLQRHEAQELVPVALRRSLTHCARLVLLYGPNDPRAKSPGKQPIDDGWPSITVTEKQVIEHVIRGGNLGMKCGDGLVVLDFDDEKAEEQMLASLGPIVATVQTGSGKRHYYFAAPKGVELPAKILWEGSKVGEIQRTQGQQVVCPPSVHPKSKAPYQWATEAGPLQELPDAWIKHLLAASRKLAVTNDAGALPDYIKLGDSRGHEADGGDWSGPDAEEILARASKQPGARRRAGGWKFQCPGCRREGHDKHRDNAVVRNNGRWGCALNDEHSRDIGEALGIRRSLSLQSAEQVEDEPLIEQDLPLQTEEPAMEDQE